MTNLADAFKQEISRLARKEAKAQVDPLKTITTRHRAELAKLKREIVVLQKELKKASSDAAKKPSTDDRTFQEAGFRFSPAGLRRHRVRLGLSADGLAKLLAWILHEHRLIEL